MVYHCLQDASDDAPPEYLTQLEATITGLREDVAAVKSTEKALRAEHGTILAVTSTADLRSTVEALTVQKEGLLERLSKLKTVEVQPVSEAERRAVLQNLVVWQCHASQRKSIMKDLWQKLLDIQPPEELLDEELWVWFGFTPLQ